MVRRWIGLDLNGWRDFAARDWSMEDDGAVGGEDAVYLVDGGSGSVVVRLEDGSWVGGPQAALAPHGRGGGWGSIGDRSRRRSVRTLLDEMKSGEDLWASAAVPAAAVVKALSPGAQEAMLAVPDIASFDEAVRGRLLAMLRKQVRMRAQLVPRSVALFHGAAQSDWEAGFTVRLITHDPEGLEVQHLTLRDADGFKGHLAPERLGYGLLTSGACGLNELEARVEAQVRSANLSLQNGDSESSRLPFAMLFGEAEEGTTEALRNSSGDWVEALAPELNLEALFERDCIEPTEIAADLTILCTPLGGRVGDRFEEIVRARFGDVTRVSAGTIARGALRCGRLKQKDLPHYLDRLEPISLAVNAANGPRWEPLIPLDRNVPANREYVSDPMEGFVWPAGTPEIEFFVLKGGKDVRHWRASKNEGPKTPAGVSLKLRQTPGQSWAHLTVSSTDWSMLAESPLELDWEHLAPEDRAPDEILKQLDKQRPVVPKRIVEPANIGLWDGSLVYPGVEAALATDEDDLYKALSRVWSGSLPNANGYGKSRPISTDGELPDGLSRALAADFDGRLESFADKLVADTQAGYPPELSRPLLCLTWSFTRCPEPVVDVLLESFEAFADKADHPLLKLKSASRTIQSGLGRVVRGEARIRRMLWALGTLENWSASSRGALSYVLSRRSEAPAALWLECVDDFAGRLADDLAQLVREKRLAVDFKYILMTLVGLLRYREIDANALTVSSSQVALVLCERLERAKALLAAKPKAFAQSTQKVAIIEDVLAMLRVEGGDANLLTRIEALNEK